MRKLMKEEMHDFYRDREIIYCTQSCGLNLYRLYDKFIFQYFPKSCKEGIVELVFDSYNELFSYTINKLNAIKENKFMNSEIVKLDIEKAKKVAKYKEPIILSDFDRTF